MKNNIEVIYKKTFSKVYQYVSYRVDNTGDAEDLVSEIFYKISKSAESFKGVEDISLFAWVFSITRSTLYDYYKERKKTEDITDIQLESDTNLEKEIEVHQDILTIKKALLNLTENEREIFIMRYFSEFTNKEISIVLNLSEKGVSSMLSKSLKKVKAITNTKDI